MKKLLSLLAISSLTITVGTNVTSCFLFPKKESLFDQVCNKIEGASQSLTWENKDVTHTDQGVSLAKPPGLEEGQLPDVWTDLLTDLFGLQSSETSSKNEFRFITNITDNNDDLLKNNQEEDVSITLSSSPTKPTDKNSKIFIKKITWTTGEPTDEELVDGIYNQINNSDNIYGLGINLTSDSSDAISKDAITHNIGLNDTQSAITTLSGTLTEDAKASINFNIKQNSAEKTLTKDVTWYKQSPDFKAKYSEYTTLINGYIYSGTRDNGLYRSEDGINFNQVDNTNLGSKRCDIIYQTSNKDIYVGTRGDGIYKSTDGDNFTQLDAANIGSKEFDSIFEFAKNNTIYAGTGEDTVDGLWKSTDGNTFSQVDDSTIKTKEVHSILSYNDELYIATNSGLYKSTDGNTFSQVDATNLNKEIYNITIIDGDIYAGTTSGLYKSTDGTNFSEVDNTNLGTKDILSIIKASDNNFYVGTESNGLWKSTDGGTTFENVPGSITDEVSHIQEFNNTLLLSYDSPFTTDQEQGIYYYHIQK